MHRTLAVALYGLLSAGLCSAQPLHLTDCRINAGPGTHSLAARCGSMMRPLDPSGAVGGEIALRIAVVPATNLTPEPDPFVPIAGGPGPGSVQFSAAYSWAFDAVRRDRDILLVDQRGTGESATMDCEINDDLIDGEYSIELTVEHARRCLDQLPYDPRFFTTSIAVADLEAVRAALGYRELNLYGVSYGTRVAQHFARRYPASTRTLVIDGVVPPQISLGPEIATESQRTLDNIFARCEVNPACGEKFGNLAADFERLVVTLREAPVELSVPNPSSGRLEALSFGGGELAAAIRLLAYHPNTAALIPLLISEASKNNFVPLASQFMMTMITVQDALALGMHNTVVCAEDVPFFDTSTIDYEGLGASYMGAFQLEALQAICSVWPVGPVDDAFKAALATDLPVLLLSGSADPITPPRYAELAAVGLKNATHLIGKNQGHGQISVGCTAQVVSEFVASADPSSIDADCLQRSFVMPFFVDFSGPEP